jgi:hypothetical protein
MTFVTAPCRDAPAIAAIMIRVLILGEARRLVNGTEPSREILRGGLAAYLA